ncbi:Translation initiation factor IF-2 [Frankliniella fusca]|uniref:Translation initiation factor IF-2 n=1 Tax=Frankliniella fusca TaxID=407009 RepID=A0AAE1H2H4_9NEOP|nr:Translation initiation factor IF-2 [Frankliniella fusca]KAK3929781.1 Translation initiation factor IF-2 [Frankliniella fusca]
MNSSVGRRFVGLKFSFMTSYWSKKQAIRNSPINKTNVIGSMSLHSAAHLVKLNGENSEFFSSR